MPHFSKVFSKKVDMSKNNPPIRFQNNIAKNGFLFLFHVLDTDYLSEARLLLMTKDTHARIN